VGHVVVTAAGCHIGGSDCSGAEGDATGMGPSALLAAAASAATAARTAGLGTPEGEIGLGVVKKCREGGVSCAGLVVGDSLKVRVDVRVELCVDRRTGPA
jgi:hypothetical protein